MYSVSNVVLILNWGSEIYPQQNTRVRDMISIASIMKRFKRQLTEKLKLEEWTKEECSNDKEFKEGGRNKENA